MPEKETSFDYKIGQLTGQIGALIDSNKNLAESMRRIEENFEKALDKIEGRVDQNLIDTVELKARMSILGGIGGIVGGIAVMLFQKYVLKI